MVQFGYSQVKFETSEFFSDYPNPFSFPGPKQAALIRDAAPKFVANSERIGHWTFPVLQISMTTGAYQYTSKLGYSL